MDASDVTARKSKITIFNNYIRSVQHVQPLCVTGSCIQVNSTCILNYPDYATREAVTTGLLESLSSITKITPATKLYH